MNVLILAEVDHTGAGYALSQAINAYTEHKARAVSFRRSWLQYPFDVLSPDPGELCDLIDWADVVNVHDQAHKRLSGMPFRAVVVTYHGSYYRRRWRKLNARDAARGWVQTCLTIDLSMYGPTWIGRPMEVGDVAIDVRPARFLVAHCPTQRTKKGTEQVIKAIAPLVRKGIVDLDIVEGVTNREALARKRRAHALVDQVGERAVGYGTNSLEAWAMGIPVVSGFGDNAIYEQFMRVVAQVPFVRVSSVDGIRRAVLDLQGDSGFYGMWARRGRQFVKRYHDPEQVSQRFLAACAKAERTQHGHDV